MQQVAEPKSEKANQTLTLAKVGSPIRDNVEYRRVALDVLDCCRGSHFVVVDSLIKGNSSVPRFFIKSPIRSDLVTVLLAVAIWSRHNHKVSTSVLRPNGPYALDGPRVGRLWLVNDEV